jgi:hypothetical protein
MLKQAKAKALLTRAGHDAKRLSQDDLRILLEAMRESFAERRARQAHGIAIAKDAMEIGQGMGLLPNGNTAPDRM